MNLPKPHKAQLRILAMTGRYNVACCGRRLGKTTAAAIACLKYAAAEKKKRIWWCAPTLDQSIRVENDVVGWIRKSPAWKYVPAESALIHVRNQSRIEFHTTYLPDRLRGAGLDYLVIDETADVSEYAWAQVLRPMLLESKGRALFLGTPRGKANWFYKLFCKPSDMYDSLQIPTSESPLIDPKELHALRQEMPPALYAQEFLATFNDSTSIFFPDPRTIAEAHPTASRPYTHGIDLARHKDRTVISTFNATKQMVQLQTFHALEWQTQMHHITDTVRQFPGPAWIDSTGVGDPIAELLSKTIEVIPYTINERRRSNLLIGLSLAMARKELTFLPHPELFAEFDAFNATTDRTCPDDIIFSCALAAAALSSPGKPTHTAFETEGIHARLPRFHFDRIEKTFRSDAPTGEAMV